jgi:hypothetical protein
MNRPVEDAKTHISAPGNNVALPRLDAGGMMCTEAGEEAVKQSDVEARLKKAEEKLLRTDRFLLENDVNERSITHKLAQYLQEEFFPEWDVDCEYNRVGTEEMAKKLDLKAEPSCTDDTHARTVYPDIIVHHRGKEYENLLVIEAKKNSSPAGTSRDEEKLKAFGKELGYKYCVLVTFERDRASHRCIKPTQAPGQE